MPVSRPQLPAGLLAELRGVVGDEHVVTDPDLLAGHEVDWTGRFGAASPALVRPGDAAEAAAVLAVCDATGTAVVPQGGNTGLVGGSVPRSGEVLFNLGRLDWIRPVDPSDPRLVAGAGATLQSVQAAAADAGWVYGVDLGARGSATLGGTIATNAGGNRVVAFGDTRAQLLGIEVALADGTLVSHLDAPPKDNTGYDLASLVCGSEGTLGVVTAAAVRLHPPRPNRTVALVGFDSVAAAVASSGSWRRQLEGLEAVELVTDEGMALVESVLGLPHPMGARRPCYLLVEVAGSEDPSGSLAAVVGAEGSVRDVAVATQRGERERLWRYREAHSEAIGTLGVPHKLDVSLPRRAMADFVDEVRRAVASIEPGARTWIFGHVEDGNLHVNVTGVDAADGRVDRTVLELVAAHGGSISAEHGIGVAKRAHLHLSRSPGEIATFARIKAALDPNGILNPGVLLQS